MFLGYPTHILKLLMLPISVLAASMPLKYLYAKINNPYFAKNTTGNFPALKTAF